MSASTARYGSATAADRAGQPPPAESPVTSLQEILGRLISTREDLTKLSVRLLQAADRGLGVAPQSAAGTNGQVSKNISGVVQEINEVIDAINQITSYAHEQATRIERLT